MGIQKSSINGPRNDRSPRTERAYRDHIKRLIRRWQRETGTRDDAKNAARLAPNLVEWLIDRKRRGKLASVTWRQYRAALLALLPRDQAIIRARLAEEGPLGARQSRGLRAVKYMGRREVYKLRCALRTVHPETRRRLIAYFAAGITTGLRPSEWEDAVLGREDGRWVLRVRNAKHTHGRGHGPQRAMVLLTEKARRRVRRYLRILSEWQAEKPRRTKHQIYENLRKALHTAVRRAGYAHQQVPTLYTVRHQFKINARAAGVDPVTLAYLMGHGWTGTAARHYGRPRARTAGGFSVLPAEPIPPTIRIAPESPSFRDPVAIPNGSHREDKR
ncbi:MAG: hypothetical protein ACYDDA_15840 [Acidiferrobacteraceae bacterium]